MIKSYKYRGTEDIFNGKDTKSARKTCPQSLWKVARRKLDQLDFAASLNDLRSPPRNKLEALKGDRKRQYSTVFASMTNTEFALFGLIMV